MSSDHNIIICFCEDIPLEELQKTILAGAHTLDEIKRLLRCGMGACQGKTCENLIINEIMKLTGKKRSAVLLPKRRPLTVGITIEDVVRGDKIEE